MDKKQTQYASAAPSLTDLLNLPSKTEPVKAQKPLTGLKAPVMGLAPARKPTMALKLVKRTSTVAELDHEQAKAPKVEEFNENIVEPKVAVEKVVIETVVNETLAKPIVVAETVKKPLIVETVLVAKPVSKPAKPAVNPAIVRQGGGKVWQDQSLMDWDPNHFLLFVGNLGPEVSEQLLQQTFSNPFPSVSRVRIVKDKKTDKSKGYGFVAFADGKEFLKALKEMQGRWIGNRQVQIKKSDFNKKS